MNNEVTQLRFAASAAVALLGLSLTTLIPVPEGAFILGPLCMMGIIMILVVPSKRSGHWEDVPPLPSDIFSLEERKKNGRLTWTKKWVYD
jgi:hypothetical protein